MNWSVVDTHQFRVPYAALTVEAWIEVFVSALISPERNALFWIPSILAISLYLGMFVIMMRPCFIEFARLRAERQEMREFFKGLE